ncbi:MAG: hypothetical protein COA58_04815 [Bacteroidetes bacterium]|nr:MAG: hypothetical protein COA58_04815 [Bacteroidota bacterium]
MKKILSLFLIIFLFAACSTVHKNGYHQTRKYNINHVFKNQKKSVKRTKSYATAAEEIHLEISNEKNILTKDTNRFEIFKHISSSFKTALPSKAELKERPVKAIVKKLRTNLKIINPKDSTDEPPEAKIYNMESIISFIMFAVSTIGSIVGVFPLLMGLMGIAAIILAFIGWKSYKKNPEAYMGKFFIYASYVYAWINIILVALLLIFLAVVLFLFIM